LDEKAPIFRDVSLRIGRKGPSLRDGSVTRRARPDAADNRMAIGSDSHLHRIGAVIRWESVKAVVGTAQDPSESRRDIRYLPIAFAILPHYPHI
jgi:hypothetical protein